MIQELRSANWQIQNRQEYVNNSTGNGVAKELTCMTHGHELRKGDAGGGDTGWRTYWGEKMGQL